MSGTSRKAHADNERKNAAWKVKAAQFQQQIAELYAREREAERQGNFTP